MTGAFEVWLHLLVHSLPWNLRSHKPPPEGWIQYESNNLTKWQLDSHWTLHGRRLWMCLRVCMMWVAICGEQGNNMDWQQHQPHLFSGLRCIWGLPVPVDPLPLYICTTDWDHSPLCPSYAPFGSKWRSHSKVLWAQHRLPICLQLLLGSNRALQLKKLILVFLWNQKLYF